MKMSSAWRILISLIAMIVFAPEGHAENEALLQLSRKATKEFGTSLKEQLTAALETGGPLAAIEVCKAVADQFAADISHKYGLTIRRTALRVRNDGNTPDPFERQTLERFVKDIAAGKDAASLEHSVVVTTASGNLFRYMKAIPTAAEPCLACHGPDVAADVRERLRKLYPNDQAIGFKAGELRGAFSVSVDAR